MKFKKEIEIEIGEWSGDSLYAREWPWNHYIKHERDIPQEWPRDAIDYGTRVIHENRELEKDETRLRGTGEIVKMLSVNGAGIMTSAGVYLVDCDLPERLAFIEANKPKEWTVSEWELGTVLVRGPNGEVCSLGHERYIGDWPQEIKDLARKRIIANRPIGAHEFRPVHAPETIGVFEVEGRRVVAVERPGRVEQSRAFEDVRRGEHGCNETCLEKYRHNALRMIAWCREQPAYKAWLKEYQRTHSELGEDGVLRFADVLGDEAEVRAVSGGHEWRARRTEWGDWLRSTLPLTDPCHSHRHHAEAIRKLCSDWEAVNKIGDVTINGKWEGGLGHYANVPPQFQGRKFTVTFSDVGPIGGQS